MLVRNQYIYLKTTIEDNEQKILYQTPSFVFVMRLEYCAWSDFTLQKTPKRDYRAANGKQFSSPLALFAPFKHQI